MVAKKKLRFPLGGENRSGAYVQTDKPYTTLRAVNCRSTGSLERRGRGGSRPGMVKFIDNDFGANITCIKKVSYLDSSGDTVTELIVIADGNISKVSTVAAVTTTSYLTDDDGNHITIGGDNIIFKSTVDAVNPIPGAGDAFQVAEYGGRLLIAGSTVMIYDPMTGSVETIPNAPTNQPFMGVYRDRLMVSGDDNFWYASAMGDFEDWDFVENKDNDARATGGILGDDGAIGGNVTAMFFWNDEAAILSTSDGIWVIYGDPVAGRKVSVSRNVGIIAPQAASITPDGLLVFLARDGLYSWQIGSKSDPEKFSAYVLPEDLRDVSITTNTILMQYDHKNNGIHLFVTPATGSGEHWWLALKYKALWSVKFATATHQPIAVGLYPADGDSNVVIGSKDGYLRKFSKSALNDDGSALNSDLLIGPIDLGGETKAGLVQEMVIDLADNTIGVTWRWIVAKTAEECADIAESYVDGTAVPATVASGALLENHNPPVYPRSSGGFGVLWIDGVSRWSYEAITIFIKKLGRLR